MAEVFPSSDGSY